MELEFESRVVRWHKALAERIRICEQQVQSVGAFFAASEVVTRQEFESFCQVILLNPNSLQALEWAPRVSHEDRAAFKALRSDLVPRPFTLIEKDDSDPDGRRMVKAGPREE